MSTATALARLQRLAAEQKANGTAAKPFFMAVGLHKPREKIPAIQFSARPPLNYVVLAAAGNQIPKQRFHLNSDQRWARYGCKRRHRWAASSLIPATAMPRSRSRARALHAALQTSHGSCRSASWTRRSPWARSTPRFTTPHRPGNGNFGLALDHFMRSWALCHLACTPRATCPTGCLHSADADWCLNSHAVSKLGLQVRAVAVL